MLRNNGKIERSDVVEGGVENIFRKIRHPDHRARANRALNRLWIEVLRKNGQKGYITVGKGRLKKATKLLSGFR